VLPAEGPVGSDSEAAMDVAIKALDAGSFVIGVYGWFMATVCFISFTFLDFHFGWALAFGAVSFLGAHHLLGELREVAPPGMRTGLLITALIAAMVRAGRLGGKR
jgi:hypothetical protein